MVQFCVTECTAQTRALPVPNRGVAMHARDAPRVTVARWSQALDEAGVTANAVVLEDGGVCPLDANGLFEVLKGKALRVMPAVARLGQVLRNECLGEVASR